MHCSKSCWPTASDASHENLHGTCGSVICACAQDLLTILTPVYPDEHTLSLLRNQLRTFAAFADIDSFAAWVMVTPAAKLTTLQMFLDFELAALPPELSDKVFAMLRAHRRHYSKRTAGPAPSCSILCQAAPGCMMAGSNSLRFCV